MRVLVESDGIGALTSAQAGATLASGWAGADVRVLSVGDSGHGFLTAYADLLGTEVEIAVEDGYAVTSARADGDVVLQVSAPEGGDGLPLTASSRPLGSALARVLASRPDRVLLDLTGLRVHDGGAGMLAGLGLWADQEPIRESSPGHGDRGRSRRGLRGPRRHRLIGVVRRSLGQNLLGCADHLAPRPGSGTDPRDCGHRRRAGRSHDSPRGPGDGRRRRRVRCVSDSPCWPWAARLTPGRLGLRVARRGASAAPGRTWSREFGVRLLAAAGSSRRRRPNCLRRAQPCVLIAGEVVVGAREMRTMASRPRTPGGVQSGRPRAR